MDAKCDGIAFTPRQGKPVEINALWYHALMLMDEERAGGESRARVFAKAFWISPFRGLADVGAREIGGGDSAIRPNQIFAVSLAEQSADAGAAGGRGGGGAAGIAHADGIANALRAAIRVTRADIPGGSLQRDAAYHNGTVWPWLMGAFLEAYLRVNRRSEAAMAQAKQWLEPLIAHM